MTANKCARLIADFNAECRQGWTVTLGKRAISWGRYPLAEVSIDTQTHFLTESQTPTPFSG
jgi:hypothetical protein